MTHTLSANVAEADLLRFGHLFAELQDLKRIQPLIDGPSIATELFRDAWAALIGGENATAVADRITLRALTGVLLPGCSNAFFQAAGYDRESAETLLRNALLRIAGDYLHPKTLSELSQGIEELSASYFGESSPPPDLPRPLEILVRRPRAGATHPDHPRMVLCPPELHGEHCLLTAVYAALLARTYAADRGEAFLGGLAHHLHNAIMPDCGYAGEICMGDRLVDIITTLRERALGEIPEPLASSAAEALTHHEQVATPEGRALSAADVLDRVLDVKWRTRAAAVTDRDLLEDLDLVHDGPIKSFQTEVLSATRVWNSH